MFLNTYKNRNVFITGHTGFKGSWLSFWLYSLGAKLTGYSKDIPTEPANFNVLNLASCMGHFCGDVTDYATLFKKMQEAEPEIVFHLAAQALVKKSYADPCSTFSTNAIGTMNVLEAARHIPSVKVVVLITSDKVYRNKEWLWGYRESDEIGGDDPYSASKGCAELIAKSYFESFYKNTPGAPLMAASRAGNVIGGGDWAADRIVPDYMRAWDRQEPLIIRSPRATRPWQHVLEPLSGYLWLGAKLFMREELLNGESFNFGPDPNSSYAVEALLQKLSEKCAGATWEVVNEVKSEKEAGLLKLCCDKALLKLGWMPTLDFEQTLMFTAQWYEQYLKGNQSKMIEFTAHQVNSYVNLAKTIGSPWAL